MNYDKKIDDLFIDLPEPPKAVGTTLNAVQTGKLVYLSGALPWKEGKMMYKGRVGVELNLDAGKMAAHAACLQALGMLKHHLGGSLNNVRRIVHLFGAVASGAEFHDQHKVIDGASELLASIFGENGRHARTCIGVNALPFGATVEIQLTIEVK